MKFKNTQTSYTKFNQTKNIIINKPIALQVKNEEIHINITQN